MIPSSYKDISVSSSDMEVYFGELVNRFFKILPMRENNETTLNIYIASLQLELIGYRNMFPVIGETRYFISLLSILEFLKENPAVSVSITKREVFNAINLCNRIKDTVGVDS